jgi:hypothetical protein
MLTHWARAMVGTVVLVSGLPLHAQDVPALTARLGSLGGKDALRVTVVVEAATTAGESKTAPESEKLHLSIARDPAGLSLTVAEEVADTRLFQEFSLFRANEIIHRGASLARELTGMQLVESGAASREGVPCTRWLLQADETHSQSGATAKIHRTVELWLDADGYPVAASFTTQVRVRMLLFKMTRESKREQRYRHVGDHLVLTLDKTEDTEGDGKSKDAKRTITTTASIADRPTP